MWFSLRVHNYFVCATFMLRATVVGGKLNFFLSRTILDGLLNFNVETRNSQLPHDVGCLRNKVSECS